MTHGTRSLAVLGVLSLSAVGLVPAAWATDAGAELAQVAQSGVGHPAQSGEQRAPETSGTPTAQGSGITQGQSASSMTGEGQLSAPESRGSQPSADVETTGGVSASAAATPEGAAGRTVATAEDAALKGATVDTPIPEIQAVGEGDDSAMEKLPLPQYSSNKSPCEPWVQSIAHSNILQFTAALGWVKLFSTWR